MLHRINELLQQNKNFAFETTLSTRSYKNKVLEAKRNNYNVTLLFFWLKNPELAIERVKTRVKEGVITFLLMLLSVDIPKELKTYSKFIFQLWIKFLSLIIQRASIN